MFQKEQPTSVVGYRLHSNFQLSIDVYRDTARVSRCNKYNRTCYIFTEAPVRDIDISKNGEIISSRTLFSMTSFYVHLIHFLHHFRRVQPLRGLVGRATSSGAIENHISSWIALQNEQKPLIKIDLVLKNNINRRKTFVNLTKNTLREALQFFCVR